jgi:adenosylhomocysteine nucleosidase
MAPIVSTDVLVVFALESEAGGLFDDLGDNLLYTGVGKINAAYRLTRRIGRRRPSRVVSFGTAGSPRCRVHSLVECTSFVQRDMDARGLGFALGTTPLDPSPPILTTRRQLMDLPEARCGSGDSFVIGHDVLDCDVVDMEAYALAKICALENLPLLAVKYVTDGGDQEADVHWTANLPRAAAAFRTVYDALLGASAPCR